MAVRYEWADASQQVLWVHIEAPWTWAEYRILADQVLDQIRRLDYPVATIVIVKRMGKLPAGDFLSNLQYIDSHMPVNVYASVLVGAPRVVTAFINILTRIRPREKTITLYAKSPEEALALVQQRRQELSYF